jgi:hypothetical protein
MAAPRGHGARVRDVLLLAGCAGAVAFGFRIAHRPAQSAEPPPEAPPTARPLPAGATATAAAVTPKLENGGCVFPDPGEGDTIKRSAKPFVVWARDVAVRPDGAYDLVLHAHGGEAARRVIGAQPFDIVLATFDLGALSSSYRGVFPDRKSFDHAVAGIDAAVSDAVGRPAKADRIVLSSFSAGYAAVAEGLVAMGEATPPSGVILLDSLHASYRTGTEVEPSTLEPFVAYGRRALEGRGFLGLSHSAIEPPGYASTEQVATYLLETLRVEASRVDAPAGAGLVLRRVANEKGFVVRGYAGGNEEAHCAHLGLFPELLDAWKTHRSAP